MENTRIKISSIVEAQVPTFVKEDFPLVASFLKDYYKSMDSAGGCLDILHNIDYYTKVNNNSNYIKETVLLQDIQYNEKSILVDNTSGFPKNYGLIKINNEIILYKRKTDTSFEECIRGFSGTFSYDNGNNDELQFSSTNADSHVEGSIVENLSFLFLSEFYKKTKVQFFPGFEDRELFEGIDKNLALKQSKDFYSSKGTEESFKVLFKLLFGSDVSLIKPSKFLIEPSSNNYRIRSYLVVEPLDGNIEELVNKTIFQDQSDYYDTAFGSVTDLKKIIRENKTYYNLNLVYDYDRNISYDGSLFGKFYIHSRTRILEDVKKDQNYILVDSTLGFPNSGELSLPGLAGEVIVSYTGKTTTQFIGCSGITEDFNSETIVSINDFAYGYSGSNELIKFRITGVLSQTNLVGAGRYCYPNDIVPMNTLGYKKSNDVLANGWIVNIPVSCEVKSFTKDGKRDYLIETYDNNNILDGDLVELEYISEKTGFRTTQLSYASISNEGIPSKIVKIKSKELISKIFYIRKVVSTFNDTGYATDIQNTYKNLSDNSVYVTSSSLPYYGRNTIRIKDYSIKLSGVYKGEVFKQKTHGLLTGESIVYFPDENNNLGIQKGVYYVKKIDEDSFKLSTSSENILKQNFISINEVDIVSDNYFYPLKFSNRSLEKRPIESVKLVRNIKNDKKYTENLYETPKDSTLGILLNGVELLNYKSNDYIYYGPIQSSTVLSGGSNYNVIDVPPIQIFTNDNLVVENEIPLSVDTTTIKTDSIEITCDSQTNSLSARAFVGVSGSLKRIDVIDGGFNYTNLPSIEINGGGGSGAIAKPKLIEVDYSLGFSASSSNQKINLSLNEVGFSTVHYFNTGEYVSYLTNNELSVGGISTGGKYYVSSVDDYKIRFYNTKKDSILGINTISLTSYGTGVHTIKSIDKKKKIGSIEVINEGLDYRNNKILVPSSGINTYKNSIEIYDYPYKNGDIIHYTNDGGYPPTGVVNNKEYYLTRISDIEFKLSEIASDELGRDFYFKNKIYLDLKDSGSGDHIFNYPEITVKITGISEVGNKTVDAVINPIFKGKVNFVYLSYGGEKYGDQEIINFEKQPSYTIKSGSGAQFRPIVSSGKIVAVITLNSGKNYFTRPDIVLTGPGYGAILSPVIVEGKIKELRVINGGNGYTQEGTSIDIIASGSGCKLKFSLKKWTINNFERLLFTNYINDDEGVVYKGINSNYGLQYTHLYPSKNLRKKVYSIANYGGSLRYRSDYNNDYEDIKYHSPILGWAYDGNPIYGPYGYDSIDNKKIRHMRSGYSLVETPDSRPSGYPRGFFVEDYIFSNSGDLDESNGKFAITPEFPNGTYAYFMTINEKIIRGKNKNQIIFNNEKVPVFPYVIGNYFKSEPNQFNYEITSNQDDFDFFAREILRNTINYNLNSTHSDYRFLANPIKNNKIDPRIITTTTAPIQSIKIVSKGDNYKINDEVQIDDSLTNSTQSARVKVSEIEGKDVKSVEVITDDVGEVELYADKNSIVGFCTLPHNLKNNDILRIESLSNYYLRLSNSYRVGIKTEVLILTKELEEVANTGIVTYIPVFGNLEFPNIVEDDIFSIGNEDVKVLNIDKENSRIRVLREYNGTSSSHESLSLLIENPRKFKFNPEFSVDYKLERNKKIYFNPQESLGLGTAVTGIGHTVYFSNPGSGSTYVNIPEKTIYLKNHGLSQNTPLIYNNNGGNSIIVSPDGIQSFTLSDGALLYATKITTDLIGISTVKVSIANSGNIIGIGNTSSTLFLINNGSGNYHSFKTLNDVANGDISRTRAIITTSSPHELTEDDLVNLEIISGISTTYKVEYDDTSRRIIINKRQFDSNSFDLDLNTIEISNHGFKNGQKIIYKSESPSSGLENNKMYYVVVYNRNKIKLSHNYYQTVLKVPETIRFLTTSVGYILPINPPISVIRNQKILFDLSDQSLSIPLGVGRTSCFEFNFWKNKSFTQSYTNLDENNKNSIKYFGSIGVDESCRVEIDLNENSTDEFYYNLTPIQSSENISVKKERFIDTDIFENNKILVSENLINKQYNCSGIGSTTFNILLNERIDSLIYNDSNAKKLSYTTTSKSSSGSISKLNIISGGLYDTIPGISSIISENGTNAILIPESNSMGVITDSEILDSGYDYPSDITLRPVINIPSIIYLDALSNIESIKVKTNGVNYTSSPKLLVIDGISNKIVSDLNLEYDIEAGEVKILKNTYGINNVTPKVIPLNNSNGVKITNIEYVNGNVTVTLKSEYSYIEDFPFLIGDKILVEGVSIIESDLRGYNSKNYNYELFTITDTDPNIGGSNASITYSVSSYLNSGEVPGTFDVDISSGRVILEKHFPVFDFTLSKNIFEFGEQVYSGKSIGKVIEVDSINDIIRVETIDDFKVGSELISKYNYKKSIIREVYQYESYCEIDSSAVYKQGWDSDKSRLSENSQRIHDSDYYQYFSYSLNSQVPINEWEESVNSLNHTIGFKLFSDLSIVTTPQEFSGIGTDQNDGLFSAICELNSAVDTYCVSDFDLVSENNFRVDLELGSNEIKFNSRIIQDYIDSIGNVVLIIDDISDQFNTNENPTFITSFEI